jgi:hypothetical protein
MVTSFNSNTLHFFREVVMKRFLGWALVGLVAGMGMVGCDLLSAVDNDTCDIKINNTLTTVSGDSYVYVDATVTANVEIEKINATVTTKDGADVPSSEIKVEKQTIPTGEKKIVIKQNGDMEIKITVDATACDGDYILTLEATAGSVSSSKEDTFTVSGAKDCSQPDETPLTESEISAGANKNTEYGSSIDIDAGKSMLASEAADKVADIDLCYAYSGVASVEKLGTAKWALDGGFDFADGWSSPPNVKFYKVTMTEAEFTAVDTKEAIEALWDATKATANNYTAAEEDVFLVETTEGALAILRISSQVEGNAGSITMKVAK